MARRKHPSVYVFDYFRTASQEACELSLSIIKAEMDMRFKGRPIAGTVRRKKAEKQLELPFPPKEG